MTNPSTNAPYVAQTQNTSSEYLTIDFSHRLPSTKIDDISFIDAIDHFAYRAIGVLEVIQLANENFYEALGTAISEIEDIRGVAIAYSELLKNKEKTSKPLGFGFEIWNIGVTFTKNTNHQT